MHGASDNAGPAGLMAGAEAGPVVAVEVFVKEDEVAPVGILLEFPGPAVDWSSAVRAFEEDVREPARDFLGNLVQVHVPAGAGRAFDGEVVAVVGVVLQQRANDQAV